jgi:hypothetical protein
MRTLSDSGLKNFMEWLQGLQLKCLPERTSARILLGQLFPSGKYAGLRSLEQLVQEAPVDVVLVAPPAPRKVELEYAVLRSSKGAATHTLWLAQFNGGFYRLVALDAKIGFGKVARVICQMVVDLDKPYLPCDLIAQEYFAREPSAVNEDLLRAYVLSVGFIVDKALACKLPIAFPANHRSSWDDMEQRMRTRFDQVLNSEKLREPSPEQLRAECDRTAACAGEGVASLEARMRLLAVR